MTRTCPDAVSEAATQSTTPSSDIVGFHNQLLLGVHRLCAGMPCEDRIDRLAPRLALTLALCDVG